MNKRVEVFNEDITFALPEALSEFMGFWEEKMDLVPEEHRKSARISLDYYDGLELVIFYTRPETEEDKKVQRDEKEKQDRALVCSELAELRRLQAKYGNIKG